MKKKSPSVEAALIKRKGGAFDRTRAAYLVEIKGADHFAWAAGGAIVQRDIAALCIAFLNTEFKSMEFARPNAASVAVFKRNYAALAAMN